MTMTMRTVHWAGGQGAGGRVQGRDGAYLPVDAVWVVPQHKQEVCAIQLP
jgi:hypothetical protein